MPDVNEQVNAVGLELTARGIAYDYADPADHSVIQIPFGGGDYSFNNVTITVDFDEDGESAQLATSPIVHCPGDRTDQLLPILNECNLTLRWAKFYLDDNNDIIADTDVVFGESDAGFAVVESVMLAASVIDDAYPQIIKGIWN